MIDIMIHTPTLILQGNTMRIPPHNKNEEEEEGHVCNAGVSKVEVLANGWIIPCAAFKGAARKYPHVFVLGDVTKGDTIQDALKKGRKVSYLLAFRRQYMWRRKYGRHQAQCSICQGLGACPEGRRLLVKWERAHRTWEEELKKVKG